MPRANKPYIVPKTSRLCATFESEEIKEIRKISIDLEIPESEVLRLAVKALVEKYHDTPIGEIREKGMRCFVSCVPDTEE